LRCASSGSKAQTALADRPKTAERSITRRVTLEYWVKRSAAITPSKMCSGGRVRLGTSRRHCQIAQISAA